MMQSVPALIVGGGPAGTAAAITLARAGIGAYLVDRHDGPHDSVCGGFLGWDALAALRDLGLDVGAMGARPIDRLRMRAGERCAEMALPHRAAGLSRRALDEALIGLAEEAGAVLLRGRPVRAADPAGRSVRFDDGDEFAGEALFLATGKYELRGLVRDLRERKEPPSVGLRAVLPVDAARSRDLAGMIELHLFERGYAGLLLQEDGTTNLCLSVARERLAEGVPALMAQIMMETPRLAERMEGAPAQWEAVAGVPYGWRAAATSPGVFRVGDQGAVIASLAGDGIAIALSSGVSAAQAFLSGGPDAAVDWQRRMHRRNRRPLWVAEALRHAAAGALGRSALLQLLHWLPGLGAQAALLTRVSARHTGGTKNGARSVPDRG